MGVRRARGRKGRARGVWSAAIRERFLKELRRTGNARAAYRAIGHENMFRKRRRRDPDFARDWAAAVAATDKRLGQATRPFPPAPPPAADTDADPAAPLRPGPKTPPSRPQHVIRRCRSGRLQIALAPAEHMTAESEADFLARLKTTGNFSGSARAIGFQPASLFERMRRWPAFARDCDDALRQADVKLDYRLVAYAHALLRKPGDSREEEGGGEDEDVPYDPVMAMRILTFIDRRRHGRNGRGPRNPPPGRSFAQAVQSVLAKIAAIERHEKLKAEQAKAREEDGDGGNGNGDGPDGNGDGRQ